MGLADYFDPENVRLVDKFCRGCVHLGKIGKDGWCDYNITTGHTRPCPAGKGCTEKEVAGRKREGIVIT